MVSDWIDSNKEWKQEAQKKLIQFKKRLADKGITKQQMQLFKVSVETRKEDDGHIQQTLQYSVTMDQVNDETLTERHIRSQ
ncbi:hypothetical protein [Melghirimyces profundicolus]|uniref:hypothetical protein n=1 Tax=Melghirimyces profundicolus TaxID=1242148 RepID=UPI0011B293F0|nr:hypothetical protein [Melghirimyces profundicolus]